MKQVQFRESTGKRRTVYVTGKGVVVTLETKIGNKFYGARLTPGAARRVSKALELAADTADDEAGAAGG